MTSTSPPPRPVRLSPLEQSLIALDSPPVVAHTGSLALFERPDQPVTAASLAEHIESVLGPRSKYRHRVRHGIGGPHWVPVPRLDAAAHIHEHHLADLPAGPTHPAAFGSPRGQPQAQALSTLETLVAQRQPMPLDRRAPLWEIDLIRGLPRGGFALFTRTHLALVDGDTTPDLLHLLLSGARHDPDPVPARPVSRRPAAEPGEPLLDLRTVGSHLVKGLGIVLRTARSAGTVPASPLNVEVGPHRQYAVSRTRLSQYRRIATACRHTVNDVLLTVLAGALRTWLLHEGTYLMPSLRVLTAQSIHGRDGNVLTDVLVDLPVGEPNPLMRLHQTSYAVGQAVTGLLAVPAAQLTDLAGFAPSTMHTLAARLATQVSRRLFNTMIINAPGPRQARYVMGARLGANYPVIPLSPWQGLSIGVTSYRGQIHVGFTTDAGALPDVHGLAAAVPGSLAALAAAAGE